LLKNSCDHNGALSYGLSKMQKNQFLSIFEASFLNEKRFRVPKIIIDAKYTFWTDEKRMFAKIFFRGLTTILL